MNTTFLSIAALGLIMNIFLMESEAYHFKKIRTSTKLLSICFLLFLIYGLVKGV